jgi:hypothetical protein
LQSGTREIREFFVYTGAIISRGKKDRDNNHERTQGRGVSISVTP